MLIFTPPWKILNIFWLKAAIEIIFSRRKSMKQNTYFKYLVWYHSSSRKNFIVNWKKSSATFDHHDDVWFWVYSGARGIFFFYLIFFFWFSWNILRSMCRTTLIFLPLDRTMLDQHFWYPGLCNICSRKFSRRTWKRFFVKKFTFFKLISRKF